MANQEIISSDRRVLFKHLSLQVFNTLSNLSKESPVIGLCGGRSIAAVCEGLLEYQDQLSATDWKRLQFFMVDERLVALDEEESNFRLVMELFFGKLLDANLIDISQVHPFQFSPEKEGLGLFEYEEEFQKYGAVFDVVFLGVGEDGHIAALFPQSKELGASGEQFLSFKNSPKPPSGRMTSSPDRLKAAGLCVALFLGDAKQEALSRYRSSDVSYEQCPVKLIDSAQKSIVVSDLSE